MSSKAGLSPLDPSSFSRPGIMNYIISFINYDQYIFYFAELAVVTNVSINLNVNFHSKILMGSVQLNVEKKDDSVNEVVSINIIYQSVN